MNNSKYYQISNLYPYLKNPSKYKGTLPITMRSSWESKFALHYLDVNNNILEWSSESVIIKYISPLDNKSHRYFMDFSFKAKTASGEIKEFWVEIKPKNQVLPPKEPKKKTKGYIDQVRTFFVNTSKWETTKKIVEEKKANGINLEFLIITEKDAPWMIK